MDTITLDKSLELQVEERSDQAHLVEAVRELSSLELALVGGGTANVAFM
jgi:hypothetical protein